MPGNELGDRVHNFFGQDNVSQGQHQSHVMEGNWPVPNNFWVANQRQIDVLNSTGKSYAPQNSDMHIGQSSYPVHATHGSGFPQSQQRPDFSKNLSLNEQQYSNGSMYGNQFYQTRQNEANFLAVDTDSDQRQMISSRGLTAHELQQGSPHEQQVNASDRSETSVPHLSFDLFGGQQQMSHQQASMLQAFQRQQSGLNNMQQLQQQLMIRKMQELQRQQQLQQLDLRPQNMFNQINPYTKQAAEIQSSALVNGPPSSDALQYAWTAEPGTNWLSRGSSAMQGSPSGLVFPPNLRQVQRSMELVPQQADQSLYGVPVSSSRGLAVNQSSQMLTDRTSMSQMATSSSSVQGNQQNFFFDQIGGQEDTSISRQKFQNENLGNVPSQSLNTGKMDIGNSQVNSMQIDTPQLDLLGRQISSSADQVALDPAEEKILYGSDDNIWAAFGKSSNISGEAGNLFDDGASNEFSSIQSGSWSALMQSAVAETSSSDVGPQEEWSGSHFQNTGGPANQLIPSALSARSVQNEPGKIMPTDVSQRFRPSLVEAKKWSNLSELQKTVAEDSNLYGNASQHSLNAERNSKTISTNWAPGPSGTRQSNGWNALAAVPPSGDGLSNIHENEELPQNPLNNQLRATQGEMLHGCSLWKSNSVPGSVVEFDPVKSTVRNHQTNKGDLSLNDASASANSHNMGVGDGTSQWKNAYPLAKQGADGLGRMLDQVNVHNHGLHSSNSSDKDEITRRDMESSSMRENSSDSHRSREGGLSGANDSGSLPQGKQKTTNQLARKVPVPRKFQYHPMGNLDEDAEPTYGQPSTQGQLNKVPDQGPSGGSFPGYAPSTPVPFRRPSDSYTPDNASSPSQNMLELLHKVDQSREHGAMRHLSPSRLLEADNFDRSGRLQHSQSSLAQGFGLQLAPPSQLLQLHDHSMSSQNAEGVVNSMHASHAGERVGEKGLLVASASLVQSLPIPNEGSQIESGNDRSAGPLHSGNENSFYKAPGNCRPEFGSGTAHEGSKLQNNQIFTLNGKMDQHADSSFSGNASHSIQRISSETVLPDYSRDIQNDNLASSRGMAQQTDSYDVQHRATASTRDQMHRSQHFAVPGISREGASSQVYDSMWTNVPSSRHTGGAQYPKAPSNISELPKLDIIESSFQGGLDGTKRGNLSSKLSGINANSSGAVDAEEHRLEESTAQMVSSENIDSAPQIEESWGNVTTMKNPLDDSPANSTSIKKDIEAFGRSLKPSISSNKSYTSLNQMRASRDAETDPTIRASKRIKGPDDVLDVYQVNLMAGQQNEDNVRESRTGGPSEDSRIARFPTSSGILQTGTLTNENATPQDIEVAGLDASQSNPSSDCTTTLRVEHQQVSPQMAPSWFNQYGSLRDGKLLPMYNAHKGTSVSPGGPPSLQQDVTAQHQMILRPKKRKSATSELHPWFKEISHGSQNISTLSMAEANWTRAANRLTEKVQDDVELIEDGSPVLRSKRRLVLATQLMQQLFGPPLGNILSADASSSYESVNYAVSRVVLGDACSTASHSSDLVLTSEGGNLHPIKGKLNDDPRFAKFIEELLGKARKLENDFLRLDKSASILDLRVEYQDLEKFSIFNRFARFHVRTQTDNVDSVSTDTSMLKPCAQRYVTAVHMPRSLPETVQCLSL